MNGGSCNPRVMEINQNLNSCGGYGFAVNGTSNQSRTIHYTSFGSCTNSVGLVNTSNSIPSLSWHHVVVSINGATASGTVYVDGAVFQTMSGSQIPTFSYNNNALTFGNINANRCDWWGGYLDDIGLWNRALTASEVSGLFTAQSTTCNLTITPSTSTVCLGSSVTLQSPSLSVTAPSSNNCSNGIGTWEQLFTSAQLSGYSINRTNGYAFDTATGVYYSVSGSTTLKVDLVNKTITSLSQSGSQSSFSHGIFNYSDQKLYAHRVGRDVVYNIPKTGGSWTVFGPGSNDANSYGSQPFYDAQNNRIGFFGGYGFYSVKNWIYESTSSGWINPYANNNNCNPARRNASGIAPSKDYKKMFIFSGQGNCNGSQTSTSCTLGNAWASDVGKWCWLQDLYEYDFATNTFTTILPTGSSSISKEGSFAYNYDQDVFYILGGFTPPATWNASWSSSTSYTNTVLAMDRGQGASTFGSVAVCGTPPPVGTVSSSSGMSFYDGPRDRIIWMRPDGIWALNLNTSTTSTSGSRLWSTGDTAQSISVTPTQTTSYWLSVTQNGVTCSDTVTIYVNNPSITASHIESCSPGDSILMTVGAIPYIVPPGMIYKGLFNGHHYFLSNYATDWNQAVNFLNQYGGKLVSINTAAEQAFINSLGIAQIAWIGGSDAVTEGTWILPDGTTMTYSNWASGEPNNNLNNEDYLQIYTTGQWNDGTPNNNLFFIGEFNQGPGITWSTGSNSDSVWVTPTQTTSYWVQTTLNGETCSDSITITVSTAQIAPMDSVICLGEMVTITAADSSLNSYLWSTGDTSAWISVQPTQTTSYWLTTLKNGQTCSDTVTIYVNNIGLQTSTHFVCEPGDSVLIWTNSSAQNLTSNTCFPPGATLNNGLLAWYPFCGNANDASGNGNHAQVFGATMASDRFGTPLSAYDFDGIDDHLRAAVTNLPKGNSARSFAGWIYTDGTNANGGSGTIYHHGTISYRQRDCMLQWNNQTFSHIGEGYDFSGGSLPHGSWQHVAFTHDGTTARLYVNGALRAQSNRNYNTAVGDLFLGFNSNSGHFNGERFNGRIDDFGAWNRVLSAQEVQQLVTTDGNQTLWSNSSTSDSIWVAPTQTTTYTVQKTSMGQTCTDSVTIFVASARIQASDTAICSGGSTTLTASYNGLGQTYLWSTGDTTSQIVVAPVTTSIYSLTTTLSNGLQCVDSVRIHVNNAQITASDTVICSAGDSVLLWVPYQNAGIIPGSWGTGQSSFYSTNFNSGIDPGWTSPTGPLPYAGNRVGPFGAGTLQLNLNNLPCHDSLRFNGILQLTGTWDGNGNHCCGPDIFNIIVDGSTVFSTTFTLTQWAGNFQSYPSQYNPTNLVNNAQGTGSIANNTYLLSFNFPHTSGAIEFKLAQPASQGAADEAWYFDDFNLELFECGAGGSSIWSTGQGGDSIWVKPQQTTKYWVKRWMQGIVCSDTITVHVSNLQQNFDPLPDTLVVCNGLSTLVHVGPGFTSYQWNDATTDSVKTINTTGTYWVTVTDSLGCQATDSIWVYFSDLGASITKLNDVFCFGGNNGAISLTTFGGQPPYSITWSTGQTGISGLANLGAGVYWVTVTDALGCLRRDTIAVGQPIAPLSVNVAVNNVSCYGGATGSLISVVSGGTAPYTYSWNTVPAQTSPTASNLPAGSYTLFITDANGCNLTVTGVITQPAAPLSAAVSGTNVLCFGGTTGSASVVASGGTAPYTYSWNTSPAQTTSAATNLASGTYTVTIIDSKNCQTTQSVTITQPSAPLSGTISTTTVNCYGGSNGSATVTPSGGTGPYNFIWTTVPAQTSATASNLPAGAYSVLITDANNCSVTRTATVTQPASALAVTSTFTPVLCFGDATGSATVLATGGTAPYNYLWTSIPGLTSNSTTNLTAGTYVVVVTDAKGCTQQASIAVTQPSAPLSGTLSVTNVVCYGNATGSITANISGGTAPYSYSWSSIPGLTSNSASGLTAGTYAVNATDANGCTFSLSGTVTQPLAPLQATSSGQDALCFGAASGFAQVVPSGGTAPYSFNWNTVPAQTTPVASNLTAGTYTCTVTDANGCTQFGIWTVGQPMPLMGTSVVNDVSCGGAQDGSIQVSIYGGTGNYSISWPNGSNSLNRYQLGPGTYSYTITDENNCSFIGTATVNEPDPFRVTVDTVSPKCISTEDGRITITATGGNGMLTYYINGEVFNGMADGLGVFPYGITIMDQNGCDTSFLVDLSPVYEPCVEIPNWFSPNGNGENDFWVIQGFELEALDLTVFNVWGQIVYQTDSDNYIPWDGTYEGVSLPNGDYYYVMTSRDEHKYYSGYVTILR
jgi:gliding motility-associated-like protein